MNCFHHAAPSDEKLIGFALDGETFSKEAQSHLAQCEVCQQRIVHYQQSYASLISCCYRSQCPAGIELSLYAAGALSESERLHIANHVIHCPLCSTEVEDTYRFLRTPPVKFSMFSFPPLVPARRIFAMLVKQPEMQLALRNDEWESSWPRQYTSGSVDISLHLSHTNSGEHILLGVLTCTDPDEDVEALTGMLAELYTAPWPAGTTSEQRESLPSLWTQIDDMGNVVFKPVPIGEYVMVIHLPGCEIIVEGLVIDHS
ncbi:hypothetical protein KSF_100190 [Reticulibacter mediterranei]|uniref:Zinc-finger domain-containing protein n=1 Tax=Reticulibacter mediterranei TaxID=2778369 RepID=A0A8J3ISH3_9CHLR|nr:hypothetical protein [Reticulibacter mediterranei]GHO99971.1 hypothetical protein KSF_100190 [Reticulibacter mediterranei]